MSEQRADAAGDGDESPPWDCSHDHAVLRTRRIVGGGIQYVHQCLKCGRAAGPAVAHNKVDVLPPYWDEDLPLLHDERCRQWRLDRSLRFEQGAAARREAYQRYLLSPQWLELRRRVLIRERHVCQGCATDRATQVHHLTYTHVGRELLFQLVALCDPCHHAAHERDAGHDNA